MLNEVLQTLGTPVTSNGAPDFGAAAEKLTARLIIKVTEMAYSIQDCRENPRFSRKSEIFAKIRDFDENPGFSPKSGIFANIQDFCKNPRFS